uniref:Uncharacterized protein n=1 Tax=Romanomermis culicivorax TaxID=13658 RepID=A0A915IGC4_ROMCU
MLMVHAGVKRARKRAGICESCKAGIIELRVAKFLVKILLTYPRFPLPPNSNNPPIVTGVTSGFYNERKVVYGQTRWTQSAPKRCQEFETAKTAVVPELVSPVPDRIINMK